MDDNKTSLCSLSRVIKGNRVEKLFTYCSIVIHQHIVHYPLFALDHVGSVSERDIDQVTCMPSRQVTESADSDLWRSPSFDPALRHSNSCSLSKLDIEALNKYGWEAGVDGN